MVSTRKGTVLKDSNKETAKNATVSQPPGSKKRKAQEAPQTENKENHNPPGAAPPAESKAHVERSENATPPPAESKGSADPKPYEKTPGRVGPIKKDNLSLSPDIKPFKGPPGRKVRKTRHEKNEEYRQFARENEGHTFHE